jgi:hypothetical protein
MKKSPLKSLILALVFALTAVTGFAQYNTPVEYMGTIGKEQQDITDKFINYTSSVAHGKSARKVEKNRKALITEVEDARAKVKKMPAYESDASMKDATSEYLELCHNVLFNDYAKIVDMEEIAEQSYDNMEAYLLAQSKVDDKMKEAADKLNASQKQFAAAHNVNLIESESETGKKLEKIEKVNDYYHQVFLIFFKSTKQYAYFMQAMDKQDVSGIEQNAATLDKNAADGLAALAGMQGFNGDMSLINNCKKLLTFYQKVNTAHKPAITDYIMKNEKFQEQKKELESNPKRSQEDVNTFNKAAADMNKVGEKYNKAVNEMNTSSNQLTNDWNNAVAAFMDKQMPFKNK